MPFLRRRPEAKPAPAAEAWVRRPVSKCFACHREQPPYVYAENGHDYCVDCAIESYALIGLRPGGARKDDITLEELFQLRERD